MFIYELPDQSEGIARNVCTQDSGMLTAKGKLNLIILEENIWTSVSA